MPRECSAAKVSIAPSCSLQAGRCLPVQLDVAAGCVVEVASGRGVEAEVGVVLGHREPEHGVVVGERLQAGEAEFVEQLVGDVQHAPQIVQQRAVPVPDHMRHHGGHATGFGERHRWDLGYHCARIHLADSLCFMKFLVHALLWRSTSSGCGLPVSQW